VKLKITEDYAISDKNKNKYGHNYAEFVVKTPFVFVFFLSFYDSAYNILSVSLFLPTVLSLNVRIYLIYII